MELNYRQARGHLYPEYTLVVQALYPLATNGNATKKAAIDAHIVLVDSEIPEDSTKYTLEALEAKRVILKKNSAFLDTEINE